MYGCEHQRQGDPIYYEERRPAICGEDRIVGSVLPLAVGMLLGNLDREMRDFLARALPVMIPFFALALGASRDLHEVWQAGLVGIRAGLKVVTGIPLYRLPLWGWNSCWRAVGGSQRISLRNVRQRRDGVFGGLTGGFGQRRRARGWADVRHACRLVDEHAVR